MTGRSVKRIIFMGWSTELPPRDAKATPADDYDVLRAVLLAEDSFPRWVMFACEDREHAFKVRRKIADLKFEVEVVQRGAMLYVRARS